MAGMTTSFAQRLNDAVRRTRTPALVGIDPRYDWLPAEIRTRAESLPTDPHAQRAAAFEEFSIRLIDVIAPLVPAVKPQAAFFEELGPAGCIALGHVMAHARRAGLIVICDAKRGDIGTTAEADALTVNPYLGADTLEPFVKVAHERGAGIYVLVRTSNPGAGTFQDRVADGRKQFEHVADVVERLTATSLDAFGWGSIGAVVGATYPQELEQLRAAMPHVPFLVPGYGSQGGTAADVAAAFVPTGLGAIVNSSRGINFAYRADKYREQFGESNWEQAVEQATRDMIADLAKHTPAGAL
jgi:orotidine-5'-phosphate decarboxylase